jgi:hypothetical protein
MSEAKSEALILSSIAFINAACPQPYRMQKVKLLDSNPLL